MPDKPLRRVLLDENIDRLIRPLFDKRLVVESVDTQGWKGMRNGVLLQAASAEFDVFVTMDKSLQFQQNIQSFEIALVVVRAVSNSIVHIAPLMPKINTAVLDAAYGTATVVTR